MSRSRIIRYRGVAMLIATLFVCGLGTQSASAIVIGDLDKIFRFLHSGAWNEEINIEYQIDFHAMRRASEPSTEISMYDFPLDTFPVRYSRCPEHPPWHYLGELGDVEFPALGIKSQRVVRRECDRPRRGLLPAERRWTFSYEQILQRIDPQFLAICSAPFFYLSPKSQYDPLVLRGDTLEVVYSMEHGSIAGIVTDSSTGRILPSAAVRIYGASVTAKSDFTGRYTFDDVPPDTYSMACYRNGYGYKRLKNVVVSPGKQTDLNITMVPDTFRQLGKSDMWMISGQELMTIVRPHLQRKFKFLSYKLREVSYFIDVIKIDTVSENCSTQEDLVSGLVGMKLSSNCDSIEPIVLSEEMYEKFMSQVRHRSRVSNIIYINTSSSEYGSISGVVIDSGSGEPLPSVAVQIVGTSNGVLSWPDGSYFFIRNVPPGTYSLTFRLAGYRNIQVDKITVTAGATVEVDVEMSAVKLKPSIHHHRQSRDLWIEKTHDCVIFR